MLYAEVKKYKFNTSIMKIMCLIHFKFRIRLFPSLSMIRHLTDIDQALF